MNFFYQLELFIGQYEVELVYYKPSILLSTVANTVPFFQLFFFIVLIAAVTCQIKNVIRLYSTWAVPAEIFMNGFQVTAVKLKLSGLC